MTCFKSGKSVMTAACYKGDESMMTSLIIMTRKFVCFQKDEVDGSRVRSNARLHARLHDYRSYDHSITITFLFGINSNKRVIVKKLFATR